MVKEFDHPEFIIKDKTALKLVVQAIKRVIRDSFPVEYIYRAWKNSEGQVRLLALSPLNLIFFKLIFKIICSAIVDHLFDQTSGYILSRRLSIQKNSHRMSESAARRRQQTDSAVAFPESSRSSAHFVRYGCVHELCGSIQVSSHSLSRSSHSWSTPTKCKNICWLFYFLIFFSISTT